MKIRYFMLSIARSLFPEFFLSRNDREIRRVRSKILQSHWMEDSDPFLYMKNQRRARALCTLLQRRGKAKDVLERDVLISRYGLSIS